MIYYKSKPSKKYGGITNIIDQNDLQHLNAGIDEELEPYKLHPEDELLVKDVIKKNYEISEVLRIHAGREDQHTAAQLLIQIRYDNSKSRVQNLQEMVQTLRFLFREYGTESAKLYDENKKIIGIINRLYINKASRRKTTSKKIKISESYTNTNKKSKSSTQRRHSAP